MIKRVLRGPVPLNDKTCFEKARSFEWYIVFWESQFFQMIKRVLRRPVPLKRKRKKKKKKEKEKKIYKKELRKGILRQTLELCKLPWLACMMCLPFLSLRLPPAICISSQYISLTAFPLLIFLLIWQCWKMDFPWRYPLGGIGESWQSRRSRLACRDD